MHQQTLPCSCSLVHYFPLSRRQNWCDRFGKGLMSYNRNALAAFLIFDTEWLTASFSKAWPLE